METKPVKLSDLQIKRLRRAAAAGLDGLRVGDLRMGRWTTLLKLNFVFRGPMPPRNDGGRLVSSQKIHISRLGRDFVATLPPETLVEEV